MNCQVEKIRLLTDLGYQSHSQVHLFYALVSSAHFFLALWSRTSAIWFLRGSTTCLIRLTPCQQNDRVASLWCLPHGPECIFTLPLLAVSDNHIPTHLGENARQPMPPIRQVLEYFARLLLLILMEKMERLLRIAALWSPIEQALKNWETSRIS